MRNLSQDEYNIIYNAYVNEKRGLKYCSSLIKSSPELVKRELSLHGVKLRNRKEAAVISNKNREKKKNKDFFKTQSHDMSWLLGFLASDGSISKRDNTIKIALAQKDVEILYKIKDLLQLEDTEVKIYTNNEGYDCCSLSWSCEEHKKDLAKYFIVPAKTFILKPPSLLEDEYKIDYIRGYFDGDGSINLIANTNGRGNGNLRWQICSATPEILEWIVNILDELYNIPKVNIQKYKNKDLYYIQYSSSSTRKIYQVLYNSSIMFLDRKKKHFEEIMKIVRPIK